MSHVTLGDNCSKVKAAEAETTLSFSTYLKCSYFRKTQIPQMQMIADDRESSKCLPENNPFLELFLV